MAICSKCGKKIAKNTTKCPFCHQKVINSKPSKDFQLKKVPLKVKKTHLSRRSSSVLSSNTLIIFFIIALILINLVLLDNYLSSKKTSTIPEKTAEEQQYIELSELGSWTDQNNNLFIFAKDDNFYWYDSYLKQNDNYYKGTYDYKKGLEALAEMGYSEEEFHQTFGDDLSLDNVYSINLFPSLLIKNQQDITSTKLKDNESWWYLLIIKDNDSAIAYNKTLDLRYNLTKYNNR